MPRNLSGFKKRKADDVDRPQSEPTPPETSLAIVTAPTDISDEQQRSKFSESILMDFVETVAEINVPEYLMAILKDLFFNGRSLDKNIISDIIRLMKNTFVRFFGKTVYFRSLSESDQMLLTMKNLPLLVHYCLSRFETSDVGFDQFYWLLATYNPAISKLYSNYFHYSYYLCNVLKLISSV